MTKMTVYIIDEQREDTLEYDWGPSNQAADVLSGGHGFTYDKEMRMYICTRKEFEDTQEWLNEHHNEQMEFDHDANEYRIKRVDE
jgi:hypothetical protein